MSTHELTEKVRQLKELQSLIDEAQTEAEALKDEKKKNMGMTPLKAIRAKCLDCCCWQSEEVRQCPLETCSLFPFRFGKNPNRAGIVNSGSFCRKINGSTADIPNEASSEGSFTPAE